MAIRAVLVFNNYGYPRVSKFYSHLPTDRQQALIQLIFQLVNRRDDKVVCNFLDAPELTPLLPPPTTDAFSSDPSKKMPQVPQTRRTDCHNTENDQDPWVSYSPPRQTATSTQKRRWRPDDELRVIYRNYATLYFVLVVDQSESELGVLDLIQVWTEY